jgi:Leucine Rich repeat
MKTRMTEISNQKRVDDVTIIHVKKRENKQIIDDVQKGRCQNILFLGSSYKSVDEFISILKVIPSHVKSIEFNNSSNNRSILSICSLNDFSTLITSIPKTIEKLILPFQQLDDEHAKIIAMVGRIRSVSLVANDITDVGVSHLAKNKFLREIELRFNSKITDKGAKALVANNNIKNHGGLFACGLSSEYGPLIRDAIKEINPIRRARFKRVLGINPFMPSLKSITGFFIKENVKDYALGNCPKDVRDLIYSHQP